MDIREKIINLWVKNGEEPPYVYEIDAIISFIRQEVSEAIPKEKEGIWEQIKQDGNYLDGYNQALSDIRSVFKEKGLI